MLERRLPASHAAEDRRFADWACGARALTDHDSERAGREAVSVSGTGAEDGTGVAAFGADVYSREGDRHDQYLHARDARIRERRSRLREAAGQPGGDGD